MESFANLFQMTYRQWYAESELLGDTFFPLYIVVIRNLIYLFISNSLRTEHDYWTIKTIRTALITRLKHVPYQFITGTALVRCNTPDNSISACLSISSPHFIADNYSYILSLYNQSMPYCLCAKSLKPLYNCHFKYRYNTYSLFDTKRIKQIYEQNLWPPSRNYNVTFLLLLGWGLLSKIHVKFHVS